MKLQKNHPNSSYPPLEPPPTSFRNIANNFFLFYGPTPIARTKIQGPQDEYSHYRLKIRIDSIFYPNQSVGTNFAPLVTLIPPPKSNLKVQNYFAKLPMDKRKTPEQDLDFHTLTGLCTNSYRRTSRKRVKNTQNHLWPIDHPPHPQKSNLEPQLLCFRKPQPCTFSNQKVWTLSVEKIFRPLRHSELRNLASSDFLCFWLCSPRLISERPLPSAIMVYIVGTGVVRCCTVCA